MINLRFGQKILKLTNTTRMAFSRLKIHDDVKFEEIYDLETPKTELVDATHLMEIMRMEDGRYFIEKPTGDDEYLEQLGKFKRNQYPRKGTKICLLCNQT